MGQLTVNIGGVPQITLSLNEPAVIETIERCFIAYAAKLHVTPRRFATEIILALNELGLDNRPFMAECQLTGLLYFALNLHDAMRPGLLKGYLPCYDFTVDFTVDHLHQKIRWDVQAESERPN
jgi:hypothetical protein